MKWKVTEQWQRRYFLLKGSKYCRTHEPQRLLLWKKNSIHCSNIIVRQRSTFSKSSWLSTTTIYPWQTIMSNYLDPGVGMPYFCRSKHRPGFRRLSQRQTKVCDTSRFCSANNLHRLAPLFDFRSVNKITKGKNYGLAINRLQCSNTT